MPSSNIAAITKKALKTAIADGIASFESEFGKPPSAFSRKSELTKERVIDLLLGMTGGNLDKELYKAGVSAKRSAFSQRRNHISSLELEEIFERFNQSEANIKTYKGYRVLAVDGTIVNMPRNPKSATFVQHASAPKGYNQFHVNPLYDVLNKTYQHVVIQPQPKQDEIGALRFMLDWYTFPSKTLIVADRGYESYNLIAHFLENKVDFLIRVKQDISAMREIKKLPMTELDKDISFTISTRQTKEAKENGYVIVQTRKHKDGNRAYSPNTKNKLWDYHSPYHMRFRVVRVLLDTGEYETLITSLKRGSDGFSAVEIKELYHARWGIETAFRELKYSMGLVNLHSRKDEYVRQEIVCNILMSNFCARIASQVVVQKSAKARYDHKVNMKMAIFLCKEYYLSETADGARLLQDIGKYTEAIRSGRADERNMKVKGFVGFTYRVAA